MGFSLGKHDCQDSVVCLRNVWDLVLLTILGIWNLEIVTKPRPQRPSLHLNGQQFRNDRQFSKSVRQTKGQNETFF